MSKGPFNPQQFTPTQWSSTEDKAAFGNHFLRFVEGGFQRSLFTKKFYSRLSNCYSHIAHYSEHGFYAEWFTTVADQARFIVHTMRFPCYGDPTYTFSDVEKAIQGEIRRRNYVEIYRLRAAEAQRSVELELLARLERKYRQPSTEGAERASVETLNPVPSVAAPADAPAEAAQQLLF